MNKTPKHIAIIMDGNRRWAQKNKLKSYQGHQYGVETLRRIVRHAGKIDLKYLTVYAFSTENINRSKIEVKILFSLLSKALKEELPELMKNNVKIKFLGEINQLPKGLKSEIEKAESYLANNNGLNLQVALNYGSRKEITEAVKKIKKITEESISENLYTKNIPDPDLIIRTGGVSRLSNFLLWQAAYAELYFSDILWPDFKEKDLNKAILDYNKRERRFGK